MKNINILKLDSCNSTNTRLAEIAGEMPHATVLTTREQTAGRGQRGNTWEAEPGKNLTFSLLLRPEGVAARDQFYISEAVALGIKDALKHYLPNREVAIKWPNDIYVDDKKICGILIENTLSGNNIGRSIAGIGLNVNQTEFMSDAPNPVSMTQLSGATYDLDEVMTRIVTSILERLEQPNDTRHCDYMESLRYRQGANYIDTATGEMFFATISDVATTGHLSLTDSNGATRVYAFKEVTLVL